MAAFMPDFPDDPDGHVLARLAEHGVDMTLPMLIEFSIAVPDGRAAVSVEAALSGKGYDIELDYDAGEAEDHDGEPRFAGRTEAAESDTDEEDSDDIEEAGEDDGSSWTVYVTRRMIPAYADILLFQQQLTESARTFGGYCDGWGALLEEADDVE